MFDKTPQTPFNSFEAVSSNCTKRDALSNAYSSSSSFISYNSPEYQILVKADYGKYYKPSKRFADAPSAPFMPDHFQMQCGDYLYEFHVPFYKSVCHTFSNAAITLLGHAVARFSDLVTRAFDIILTPSLREQVTSTRTRTTNQLTNFKIRPLTTNNTLQDLHVEGRLTAIRSILPSMRSTTRFYSIAKSHLTEDLTAFKYTRQVFIKVSSWASNQLLPG